MCRGSGTAGEAPQQARLRDGDRKPKCVMSKTSGEKTGPERAKPGADAVDPARAELLDNVGGPMWLESGMGRNASERLELRVGSGEPSSKKSVAGDGDTKPE